VTYISVVCVQMSTTNPMLSIGSHHFQTQDQTL